MELRLMLDESISPATARKVRQQLHELPISSIHSLREGKYTDIPDAHLIEELSWQWWLLVTYDSQTLAEQPVLFDDSLSAGILFVDARTIAPNDFVGLRMLCLPFGLRTRREDGKAGLDF